MRKLVSAIAALAMVATFAMSAAAADWNFYGSARIETFYESVDADAATSDKDDFSLVQPNNARIGANVKVSDELTGRFEYGTDVNVRLLYGQWNFGAGSLLVGQDYTPVIMLHSQSMKDGNLGLITYGALYGGRQPQVKLRFGNFQIAAITNTDLEEDLQAEAAADETTAAYTALGVTAATASNAQRVAAEAAGAAYGENIATEVTFPRVEASYFHDFGPLRLRAQAGYATVEIQDNNVNLTKDYDAYVVGVGASYTAGPFYAHASAGMGENLTVMGISNGTGSMPSIDDNNKVVDADTTLYQFVAGYKFNDMFGLEAGIGQEETEKTGAADVENTSYYIVAPITLAPGVTIFPEYGVFDTEGKNTETDYFGVTWMINF